MRVSHENVSLRRPQIFLAFRPGVLVRLFARRIYYRNHCYVLHHNLQNLSPAPPRKIGGGELRRLRADEITTLVGRLDSLEMDDKRDLITRLNFFQCGFQECYVVDESDRIGYLNWYVRPSENDLIMTHCKRMLMPLLEGEVMLENAFTFPESRGRGFMRYAIWRLLTQAKEEGNRRVVTYIRKDNLSSLNTFMGLGFRTFRLVQDVKIMGYSWRAF